MTDNLTNTQQLAEKLRPYILNQIKVELAAGRDPFVDDRTDATKLLESAMFITQEVPVDEVLLLVKLANERKLCCPFPLNETIMVKMVKPEMPGILCHHGLEGMAKNYIRSHIKDQSENDNLIHPLPGFLAADLSALYEEIHALHLLPDHLKRRLVS